MELTGGDKLMNAVRGGGERKLAVLFERHHAKLYRYYLRMSGDGGWSEDLVEECSFRILKYRETYRQECGFTTWMYRIARNAHIEHMRNRKWEVALEEGWDGPARKDLELSEKQKLEFVRKALPRLVAAEQKYIRVRKQIHRKLWKAVIHSPLRENHAINASHDPAPWTNPCITDRSHLHSSVARTTRGPSTK